MGFLQRAWRGLRNPSDFQIKGSVHSLYIHSRIGNFMWNTLPLIVQLTIVFLCKSLYGEVVMARTVASILCQQIAINGAEGKKLNIYEVKNIPFEAGGVSQLVE